MYPCVGSMLRMFEFQVVSGNLRSSGCPEMTAMCGFQPLSENKYPDSLQTWFSSYWVIYQKLFDSWSNDGWNWLHLVVSDNWLNHFFPSIPSLWFTPCGRVHSLMSCLRQDGIFHYFPMPNLTIIYIYISLSTTFQVNFGFENNKSFK